MEPCSLNAFQTRGAEVCSFPRRLGWGGGSCGRCRVMGDPSPSLHGLRATADLGPCVHSCDLHVFPTVPGGGCWCSVYSRAVVVMGLSFQGEAGVQGGDGARRAGELPLILHSLGASPPSLEAHLPLPSHLGKCTPSGLLQHPGICRPPLTSAKACPPVTDRC